MGKLNRSVSEAKEFIEQNKGTMTGKEMGEALGGISAGRVSQLNPVKKPRAIQPVSQSVSQEATASTAEA